MFLLLTRPSGFPVAINMNLVRSMVAHIDDMGGANGTVIIFEDREDDQDAMISHDSVHVTETLEQILACLPHP